MTLNERGNLLLSTIVGALITLALMSVGAYVWVSNPGQSQAATNRIVDAA